MVKDLADVAAVAHVLTCGTNADNVAGRGNTSAGELADGCIKATDGRTLERTKAVDRIQKVPFVLFKSADDQ